MKTRQQKKLIRNIFFLTALFCFTQNHAQIVSNNPDRKIWFNHPALSWNEALPIGNGRLGAMIFGGIETERLQLNENTIWTGREEDFVNPEARKALPEIRRLLFEGKYKQAEQLAQQKMMGDKKTHSTYQTLGDLYFEFPYSDNIQNYHRELDLENAVASVTYQQDNVVFSREIFSSAPDQAIVTRLTANRAASISFVLKFSRPGNQADIKIEGDEIVVKQKVAEQGVTLVAHIKVVLDGGTLKISDHSLQIEKANSATLFITAATDYYGEDPAVKSSGQLNTVLLKNYDDLKREHIRDYQIFFKRVSLDLGRSNTVYFPTDTRLNALREGNDDPQLIALYFQYGRYLLISSSRPGGLPANLQGLWADGLNPPWEADYHININIQMNYWPVEVTNLSELHQPFLNYINELRADGKKTAMNMYGLKGTVAHFTSDAWHFTETYGHPQWAMWPMGMAWCTRHLWDHYLFTGDEKFLREKAYPAMKEASEFCMAWLVENPKTKKLVSGPSISPENIFKTKDGEVATMVMGPTMDHMIIRDLLQNTISAAEKLKTDPKFQAQLKKTLSSLSPTQIAADGRIMEWTESFEEAEPGHRHISHLYGLHPGNQINRKNNELLTAARKTIDYRLAHGGGHTGWSKAWIINFFARLHDGDQAHQHLISLLQKSTLPNLFDTHPPFQIDGNFGATAGIVEMLLQSHTDEIELLPALPTAWPSGSIHGICARGGFELKIEWREGKLKNVEILSKLGNPCTIRYGEKTITLQTESSQKYFLDSDLVPKLE